MSKWTKEQFVNLYKENITREGSEELLEFLETSDFFVAPASTRFHGSYPGGLLDHSMNVYYAMKDLIVMPTVSTYINNSNLLYSEETLSIVTLLHDLTKVGFYTQEYRNVKENNRWVSKQVYTINDTFPCGHGEKAVIMIQKYMKLTDEEILAIRCHMGAFDESVKGGARFLGQAFDQCKLAVLTHMADMMATHFLD